MTKKMKTFASTLREVQDALREHKSKLTPEILIDRGWVEYYDEASGRTLYHDPSIKERDDVNVEFEAHYYRVYHGPHKTFMALESSLEWLVIYCFLLWGMHGASSSDLEPEDVFGPLTQRAKDARRNQKFGL